MGAQTGFLFEGKLPFCVGYLSICGEYKIAGKQYFNPGKEVTVARVLVEKCLQFAGIKGDIVVCQGGDQFKLTAVRVHVQFQKAGKFLRLAGETLEAGIFLSSVYIECDYGACNRNQKDEH